MGRCNARRRSAWRLVLATRWVVATISTSVMPSVATDDAITLNVSPEARVRDEKDDKYRPCARAKGP
jgi:hypothetical protein